MLIENLFISLFKSENFYNKVYPHLKPEYFADLHERIVFETIHSYVLKYKKRPAFSDIKVILETNLGLSDADTEAGYQKLKEIAKTEMVKDEDLLIEKVEEWCKNRALEIAILESVDILQKNEPRGAIEDKIKNALSVQFEVKIGHDYYADVIDRLKWYLDDTENIPLDIDAINKAMGGGLKRKAIAVFQAPPKRGKSLWLCHCAASLVRSGKNVLYISCELSEKMISKRIDANLLDMNMKEMNPRMSKKTFKDKFKELMSKSHGQLVVKEFPNINANQLRLLLRELKNKKGFTPDVIIIDYINICSSYTLPAASVSNTNLYIGKVVMEFRNLAIDEDVAILSAVQSNRGSVKKKVEVGMEDLADSFSIAMNVDWAGAIIQCDELRNAGKYLLKTVLTRWDENTNVVYTIGVDYGKMQLINLGEEDQEIPQHIKDELNFKLQQQQKNSISEMMDFS